MSKSTTTPALLENKLQQFLSLIQSGVASLHAAAKVYVEMLNLDNRISERIIRENPHIQIGLLNKLEMVGLGKLSPTVLLLPDHSARVVSQLPVKDQEAVCSASVPVARKAKGDYGITKKRLDQMTRKEFYTAFDGPRLRPEAEQIEYLKKSDDKKKMKERRYVIQGDRIHFFADSDFSLAELSEIIRRHLASQFTELEMQMKKQQVCK